MCSVQLNPQGEVRSTTITKKYIAVSFRKYLIAISPMSVEIHMVLDNSKYHQANLLKDFMESNPQVNPIERVSKLIKSKGTHNRYFPSVGDLIWAVTEQFDVWLVSDRRHCKNHKINKRT